MPIEKPKPTAGLRHIALRVNNLEACLFFYTHFLGMKVEWQPDPDNVYLTSGNDNLALHRTALESFPPQQRLDHIGFILQERDQVDQWHDYLKEHEIGIKTAPKDHRDGSRSFYCLDPDGNEIQLIYHPNLIK